MFEIKRQEKLSESHFHNSLFFFFCFFFLFFCCCCCCCVCVCVFVCFLLALGVGSFLFCFAPPDDLYLDVFCVDPLVVWKHPGPLPDLVWGSSKNSTTSPFNVPFRHLMYHFVHLLCHILTSILHEWCKILVHLVCFKNLENCMLSMLYYNLCESDAYSDLNRDLPELKKFGISNCCKQRGKIEQKFDSTLGLIKWSEKWCRSTKDGLSTIDDTRMSELPLDALEDRMNCVWFYGLQEELACRASFTRACMRIVNITCVEVMEPIIATRSVNDGLLLNLFRREVAEATSNTRQVCAMSRSLARGHDKSCGPRHGTKISLILKGASGPRIRD